MKAKKLSLAALLLILLATTGECQETVFTLLKSNLKLADQYFEEKKFEGALSLYLNVAKQTPAPKDIYLRIARTHQFLKQYDKAVAAYEKHESLIRSLPEKDVYNYAEAQSGISNYEKAVESYQEYLRRVPDDELTIKKIWRLNNIQFLFEDSLHYAVKPIKLNSEYGELCAVPYQGGIVFMSNRKEITMVNNIDASLKTPFYRLYFSEIVEDTVLNSREFLNYKLPSRFDKGLNHKFHSGPLTFYDDEKKMIFTSTGDQTGKNGIRTLQLFFAERKKDEWKVTNSFPYNSSDYSLTDPSISKNGKLLFFSSDMKGGFGGRDIYKSEYINGQWTKPVNVGDLINTVKDEMFPYVHNDEVLYFSSNGHAGLGGLDIFRAEIKDNGFEEVQNAGYPINTNYDEFGITIDSLGTHGYFTSNRKNGGYNDDIYEFDMDLQTYPLELNGLMRIKEHSWTDSLELKVMPHAKIYLIDNIRNVSVYESSSDASGNFLLIIPYFSKYKIRVIGEDSDENIVSLEIPKHRKLYSRHEIVIVKDVFKKH